MCATSPFTSSVSKGDGIHFPSRETSYTIYNVKFVFIKIYRHRAEHRTRGTFEQIFRWSQDKKNPTFDVVSQVRRSDDRVQPHADGLPRSVQKQNTPAAWDHRPSDHRRWTGSHVGTGQPCCFHSRGSYPQIYFIFMSHKKTGSILNMAKLNSIVI